MDRVRITRDQLYAEVWAEPATKVAARYGISSTALAKICRKLDVPAPDRGYWALRAAGRAPVTPRLAPAGRNTQLIHEIVRRATPPVVNNTELPRLTIEVPETLHERHPLTEQLDSHLRAELSRKHCGAVRPATNHQCLDVSVSANTHARVLLIIDALIRGAEAREHTVEVTPVSPSRDPYRMRSDTGSFTNFVINGQRIMFHIEELTDQVPTLDGRIQPNSTRRDRSGHLVEIRPSGRLQLTIDAYCDEGERRTWRDGRSQRLEKCLGDVIELAERVAARKNAQAEEERRREAETRRQRHREALLKDCQERAASWSEVRQIEAFLDAVVENDPQAGDPTTSRGEVVAFLRAQMKAHHQHALDMSGVKLDP